MSDIRWARVGANYSRQRAQNSTRSQTRQLQKSGRVDKRQQDASHLTELKPPSFRTEVPSHTTSLLCEFVAGHEINHFVVLINFSTNFLLLGRRTTSEPSEASNQSSPALYISLRYIHRSLRFMVPTEKFDTNALLTNCLASLSI